MKNFFKKLAFVLALAMVLVSVAPATANAAAKAPSLKKTSKILYIGGDITGTIPDTYRFYFNNAKGYTATWESLNEDVVVIEGKNVVAVGVGKAVVKATLTNKAGNEVVREATVWVKQNAEKVGFGSMKAVESPLAVGAKAKINVFRQVGDKKIWTQSDVKTITDKIVWSSSDEKVATVDKWGTVTAVAPGEATITATAVQSQGNADVTSASYKVTVASGIQSVKQTGLTTAEITFAGDLSAVANKGNVTVKSMVGSTGVNVVVKDLKFDAVDKTKATITTFTEFAKDTEYVVSYKDTNASFVGVDTSKDAVASIKIDTTEVVKAKPETLKFKVYDKNGVDITRDEFVNRIDVSLVNASTDCYLDSAAKTITFFTSGKVAEVKATYHTYTYGADYKEITIDAVQTIVSKDVASTAIKAIDVFTTYTGTSADFTKPNTTISVSDTTGNYKVAVKTTTTEGKELSSVGNLGDDKFTFESSDTTTLLVVNDQLYPVKEGGAMVIVKYNKTVIGAYAVTIGSKRAAANVEAKFDKTQLATNASDSVKLTVTVKDQFGADRTGSETIKVEFVTGPTGANQTVPGATGTKLNEFVFAGKDYTKVGGYQYKVTVGNQVRYVAFTTADATGTPSFYQLSNTGKAIDTALKVGVANKTDSKDFNLSLAGYASNGYKILNVSMLDGKDAAWNTMASAATGSAVYVEVQGPGNKDVSKFVSVVSGQVVVNPVVINASGSAIKAPEGNYTVRVFEMNKTAASQTKDTVSVKPLIVGGFSITDTQQVPSITVNNTTSKFASALVALQDDTDVVTIKFGDAVYNGKVTAVTVIGTGKQIAVTEATIAVDVNYNGVSATLEQKVAIGATITLQ